MFHLDDEEGDDSQPVFVHRLLDAAVSLRVVHDLHLPTAEEATCVHVSNPEGGARVSSCPPPRRATSIPDTLSYPRPQCPQLFPLLVMACSAIPPRGHGVPSYPSWSWRAQLLPLLVMACPATPPGHGVPSYSPSWSWRAQLPLLVMAYPATPPGHGVPSYPSWSWRAQPPTSMSYLRPLTVCSEPPRLKRPQWKATWSAM